ncbi:hypothetical protein LSH36_361g07009 [Paralvinella palmiformis]|uniref:Mitochondrial import inner membrane translocase subunit TIM50 n=1 Tax=Paralvinella palmiformis TaxID=53620 RepID=A0AAD9JEJ3_9ANNE|nr:hypothetical protein LSH36_361g07009 [Paralvinella palmiformis]
MRVVKAPLVAQLPPTPTTEKCHLSSESNTDSDKNCVISLDENLVQSSFKTAQRYLLSPQRQSDCTRKCLVIDLDETLVHSSFQPVSNADFIVPVEIDGTIHQVYVLKRPYVDEFLKKMGELFECVLFTASLAKDLSRLGRDLAQVVIVDNSPASYIFHPENAVPVVSWFDDLSDTELLDLIPFFESLATVDSVYTVLKNANSPTNHNSNYPATTINTNYTTSPSS